MISKYNLLFATSLFSGLYAIGQSGPGGVGTSSNNSVWLQADDILQLDGSAVTSWPDRSGNGNDASQSVVSYQPTYETAEVNGRSVVRLDGVDDHTDDPRTYDARTFFSVYNILSANQKTSDLGQIWGSYSEGWHVAIDARGSARNWSFDGSPGLNSGNTGKHALNGAAYGGFGANPNSPKWLYNQFDLVAVEFNATRTLTRQVLGSLIPQFSIGDHQFGGDLAEVIVYNDVLNDAQRIIVENYLAARYDLSIANDFYAYQTAFGNEVAGIGSKDASNTHTDAQGSSLVRMNNASSQDDGDYLIWGHNDVNLNTGAYQAPWLGELPTGVNNSLHRLWRVDETGDIGTVNVQFDVSSLIIGATSDLVLLIDSDDGDMKNATVIPITSFSAPYANFDGIDFAAGDWFSIGSLTTFNSLPIELISFDAKLNGSIVDLKWQTASEINNDFFSVQRSIDGIEWETIAVLDGVGNSTSVLSYSTKDNNPIHGKSFYKLKQSDFNGDFTYSKIQPINFYDTPTNEVLIYPNPTSDKISIEGNQEEVTNVTILNSLGQDVTKVTELQNQNNTSWTVDLSNLSKGVYFVKTKTSVTKVYKQ